MLQTPFCTIFKDMNIGNKNYLLMYLHFIGITLSVCLGRILYWKMIRSLNLTQNK